MKKFAQDVLIQNARLLLKRTDGETPAVAPAGTIALNPTRDDGIYISEDGGAYEPLGSQSDFSVEFFEDFLGAPPIYPLPVSIAMGGAAASAGLSGTPNLTTEYAVGYVGVPLSGLVIAAHWAGEGGLATSDTDFLDIRCVNLLQAGAGTANIILATAANSTRLTGGSAITSEALRALSVASATEQRMITRNDVLKVLVTAGGAPTRINSPRVTLQVQPLPEGLRAIQETFVTTASPVVRQVAATEHGEVLCQVPADNGILAAGFSFANQNNIPVNSTPVITGRFKLSAHAANERWIFGFGSNFNSTLDNVALNAWFRCEGSLALLIESDDAGTDRDDQTTGVTLTADTYYDFKVDLRSGTSAVYSYKLASASLWAELGTLAMANLPSQGSTLLQPMAVEQKSSGTGTPSMTCDKVRARWARA